MTIDELLDDIGITPGPWEQPEHRIDTSVYCAEGFVVADVYETPDARLIAASREMLKALIDSVLILIKDFESGWNTEEQNREDAEYLYRDKITAIESATGLTWDQIKEKLDG